MKIPFSIKYRPQIESGEYKVVTSFGEPAEIVKWDCKGQYPLLACIFDGDTDDAAFYTEEGKGVCNSKENYLSIVTPEQELSEWQTFISGCLQKYGLLDCGAADRIAKECSAELLALARKEPCEQIVDHIKKAYENGKAEALKDLPRWRKCADCTPKPKYSNEWIFSIDSENVTRESVIVHKGYFLPLDGLEKLPGFNENEK